MISLNPEYIIRFTVEREVLGCAPFRKAVALRDVNLLAVARQLRNSPAFRVIRPPTGGIWFNWDSAKSFWEGIPTPTSPSMPMTYVVDLDGVHPTIEVLQEAIVPWAKAVKRGEFGKSSIVVSTRNEALRAQIESIAVQLQLPLFVAISTTPFDVAEAKAAIPLSASEDETLFSVAGLGGSADAAELANQLKLRHTAATNRLVALEEKGYLHRQKRPGRQGDLYVDPRQPSVDHATGTVMAQIKTADASSNAITVKKQGHQQKNGSKAARR